MKRAIALCTAAVLSLCFAAGAAAQASTNGVVAFLLTTGTAKGFSDQPIDAKTLDLIIQCGIRAPSAMNAQPWHFSVITTKAVMDKMRGAMVMPQGGPGGAPGGGNQPSGNPPAGGQPPQGNAPAGGGGNPPAGGGGNPPAGGGMRDMFFGSSTAIIISAKKGNQFASVDCSLACENMSIAAQAFRLGAHISASAVLAFNGDKGPELKKLLGIPDDMTPLLMLVIGYPEKGTDATSQASQRNATGVTTFAK